MEEDRELKRLRLFSQRTVDIFRVRGVWGCDPEVYTYCNRLLFIYFFLGVYRKSHKVKLLKCVGLAVIDKWLRASAAGKKRDEQLANEKQQYCF